MLLAHGCGKGGVEELSTMALTETDLPGDYTLAYEERKVEFGEFDKMVGANVGYEIGFERTDGKVKFLETIIICSNPQLIPSADELRVAFTSKQERYQVTQLSNPNIGEYSSAAEIEDKHYGEITFLLTFSKGNKYVRFMFWGDEANYELLKELARKAEGKIK